MAETLLSHSLVCLSEIDSNFNADETYLKCWTCSLYQRLLSLQPSVPRALLSRLYLQHTLLLQLHLCRLPVGRLLGRGEFGHLLGFLANSVALQTAGTHGSHPFYCFHPPTGR